MSVVCLAVVAAVVCVTLVDAQAAPLPPELLAKVPEIIAAVTSGDQAAIGKIITDFLADPKMLDQAVQALMGGGKDEAGITSALGPFLKPLAGK